jgi:hypothetical protein
MKARFRGEVLTARARCLDAGYRQTTRPSPWHLEFSRQGSPVQCANRLAGVDSVSAARAGRPHRPDKHTTSSTFARAGRQSKDAGRPKMFPPALAREGGGVSESRRGPLCNLDMVSCADFFGNSDRGVNRQKLGFPPFSALGNRESCPRMWVRTAAWRLQRVRAKLPALPIAGNDTSGAIRVAFSSMPPTRPTCWRCRSPKRGGYDGWNRRLRPGWSRSLTSWIWTRAIWSRTGCCRCGSDGSDDRPNAMARSAPLHRFMPSIRPAAL